MESASEEENTMGGNSIYLQARKEAIGYKKVSLISPLQNGQTGLNSLVNKGQVNVIPVE